MIELAQKRTVVIGLGQSGLAMACWLTLAGSEVWVFDDREQPPGLDLLHERAPKAQFRRRSLDAELLSEVDGIDLLAWSPGVSIETGGGSALYAAARSQGIPVYGELDFFMDAIHALRRAGAHSDVVAITGTNGKTTVTRLCAFLAQAAGISAQAVGNIGPSMLDGLMINLAKGDIQIVSLLRQGESAAERVGDVDDDSAACLLKNVLPRLWVLELSSFQLAVARPPACRAAVVLNITPDHLDWHESMESYRTAKLRIYHAADRRIVNLDDPLVDPETSAIPCTEQSEGLSTASGRRRVVKPDNANLPVQAARTGYSLQAPGHAGDFGMAYDGGLAWLAEAVPDEPVGGRRRKSGTIGFSVNRLMPADALRVQGTHNHSNVLAALALLRACGVPLRSMLHALRDFVADHHRCEPIAVIGGVEYIDDSKGTNVGATAAALQGMGRRSVLIAGGVGKGQDFSPLAPVVAAHARAVVLIGRDAPLLRQAFRDTGLPVKEAVDMVSAVHEAAHFAQSGDVVLLSPACASFDMFRSYAHRGEVFAEAVRRMGEEAGQPC
ncbi:MAG: UDP-N-acetylmuramoyl-L-alanine--D-glutamate ligase [Lautropia sp.]|nr:UDP-N-acetylmuramoyl-L-alanine--D-glutamate ligase [Lautropia sp.]